MNRLALTVLVLALFVAQATGAAGALHLGWCGHPHGHVAGEDAHGADHHGLTMAPVTGSADGHDASCCSVCHALAAATSLAAPAGTSHLLASADGRLARPADLIGHHLDRPGIPGARAPPRDRLPRSC